MLKPILVGFFNVHFIDVVVFNVIFAVGAFFWDYAWAMEHPLQYWLEWAGGIIAAAAGRVLFVRTSGFTVLPQLGVHDAFRSFLVATLVFVCFTFYTTRIEDPASSLTEPYASGAITSMLFSLLMLLVIELVEYYAATRNRDFSLRQSENMQAAWFIVGVVGVDLAAFLHGYLVVVIAAAAMATFVLADRGFTVAARVRAP